MHQVLFRIPWLDLPIYSYGLMMVIGFVCAIQLAQYLSKRYGIDPEIFVNAGLIALVTGVVGARLSHVIENFHQYTDPSRSIWANFFDAINIRSGGLTYYGGFLLAFPALVLYAMHKKVPLRLAMDIAAPCIVIGLGFGRIGCFLNGCCYGAQCDAGWTGAITYPYMSTPYEDQIINRTIKPPEELLVPTAAGQERLLTKLELDRGTYRDAYGSMVAIPAGARQVAASTRSTALLPAQLYSAFTAFFIAAVVLAYFTLPHALGRGFAMMLILEGSTRFILEILRVEPPVIGVFSLSMILGILLAALGVVLWFVFGALGRDDETLPRGFAVA
jgi:phosphatidylglycerol:prolipoprotein diacylglycerol transferase